MARRDAQLTLLIASAASWWRISANASFGSSSVWATFNLDARRPGLEGFLWPRLAWRSLQRKSREGGKAAARPLISIYIAIGIYLAALMLVLGWWARFPR